MFGGLLHFLTFLLGEFECYSRHLNHDLSPSDSRIKMVTVPSSYIVFCEPGSSLLAKTTGDFTKHSLSAQRCLEVKCECSKFKGNEKSGFDWQRIESGVFTPSLGAYHPFFFVVLFSAVKLTTLGQINIYFHFTLSTFQSLYFFFPFTWLKMFSQYFYRCLFQSQYLVKQCIPNWGEMETWQGVVVCSIGKIWP